MLVKRSQSNITVWSSKDENCEGVWRVWRVCDGVEGVRVKGGYYYFISYCIILTKLSTHTHTHTHTHTLHFYCTVSSETNLADVSVIR